MKRLKQYISVIIVLVSIFIIHNVKTEASLQFKDLPSAHPQYNEINYLVDMGVIHGIPMNGELYFKPADSVTRAQVAKMVMSAAGYTPKDVTVSSFSDVSLDGMTGYIERAVELGIMSPTSAGKFSPTEPIKRDEMSKVLAVSFNLDIEATQNLALPFTDVSSSNPYYKYIAALYYNGITYGIGNNLYGINEPVRRDTFSAFVARIKDSKFVISKPVLGAEAPEDDLAVARVYVTADELNVRTGSSNTSSIIGKVKAGDKLWGYSIEGNWVKVAFEGHTAYVSKSYIKFIDADGMSFDLSKSTANTLAKESTVYRGTNISTKVIATLPASTKVNVYGVKGEWSIIDVNGIPGYILSSTLKATTSSDTASTVTAVGRVTTDSLNIRQSNSASSAIVGKLKKNDVVNVNSISGWWAKITYNGVTGYVNKTYLHLMNKSGSSVKNRIIVIDPGHGGKDPGATNGSAYEKNVVLDVAKRLKTLLEQAGAKVILTRSNDTFISLSERPNIAEKNYGEMFISIHTNSSGTSAGLGTETYYNSSYDTNLTEEISLAKYINNEIVKNANMKDRGVKYANYAVTRPLEIPAILVELGFISNPSDLAKLTSDKYLQIYAQSIFNGIQTYYQYK